MAISPSQLIMGWENCKIQNTRKSAVKIVSPRNGHINKMRKNGNINIHTSTEGEIFKGPTPDKEQ